MDVQKEKHNYLAMLVAEDAITQEQCSNLSLYNGGNCFHSDFLASSKVDCINWGWSAWLKAKAQAVPEWIDYTKQSPRIDGRYQIFISGEQITADWQSPFGFSDPVEGEALIQDLISHWGMLPEPPKPQEPAND